MYSVFCKFFFFFGDGVSKHKVSGAEAYSHFPFGSLKNDRSCSNTCLSVLVQSLFVGFFFFNLKKQE